MDLGELVPIAAIIATAWVLVTFMHYRHGNKRAHSDVPTAGQAEENARLAHENETYRLTITRLEERMAVLERIATDPAERTAREIEQLR